MILVSISCKETPFFTPENNLDPESKNYIPNNPENISYELNRNLNSILIYWELSDGLGSEISGFKISTSYSDTLNYSSINYVSDFSRFGTYSYSDQINPIAFGVIYKIESFYKKNSADTVFSAPAFLEIPIKQSYTIDASLSPFLEEPYIYFNWGFNNFDGISIELFKKENENFIKIGAKELTSTYGSVRFTFSSDEIVNMLYYRLSNAISYSNYVEINSIFSPYYTFKVVDNTNNSALLSFEDRDSLSTFDSPVAFDSIMFSLWNAEVYSDSSFIIYVSQSPVREFSFTGENTEFLINQINTEQPYVISSILKRETYSSNPVYYPLHYDFNRSGWIADTLHYVDIIPD